MIQRNLKRLERGTVKVYILLMKQTLQVKATTNFALTSHVHFVFVITCTHGHDNFTHPPTHLSPHIREADITKERIQKILASDANVVLTTGGIDDLCLKYFVEAGAMAVRRCKKEDLKRIARATGATVVVSLANLEGEESFDSSLLGTAESVVQERVCDDELVIIKG